MEQSDDSSGLKVSCEASHCTLHPETLLRKVSPFSNYTGTPTPRSEHSNASIKA